MKSIDILRRAGASLRQAKARTLLTSLAIGVGAFTVTLSLAAGTGTRAYTDRLISSNIDKQMIVVAKDKSLFGEDGGMASSQSGLREYSENQMTASGLSVEQLTKQDIEKISKIEGVERVDPVSQVSPKYIVFEGNDKKFVSDIMMYGNGLIVEAAAGQLPPNGGQLDDNQIVVPESFLEKLGIDNPADAIGKSVTVTLERSASNLSEEDVAMAYATGGAEAVAALTNVEKRDFIFKISAVSKSSSMSLMEAVTAMQVSPKSAGEMNSFMTAGTPYADKYMMAAGIVKSGVDPKTVKKEIEAAGFIAKTAEDFQEMIFTMVNVLQGIVLGFGVLALIASVFGIINTQYISVLERTQQIGLMKALGMRGGHVSKLFRYEAAWIGFLGGVIGSALAIIAGTILNPWITETLKLGAGNYLLVFELVSIVIMIIALVLVAVAAGYFPARKAAKLDPIEALRTE